MAGGYNAETTAKLLESLAERVAHQPNHLDGTAVLLDMRRAWPRVPLRVRQILSPYIETGRRPPHGDIQPLLDEVAKLRAHQEPSGAVSATVRRVRAVYRLGRELSGRGEVVAVFIPSAGAAHRGHCANCEARIEYGPVWRLRSLLYCTACGPPAVDIPAVA